MINSEATVNIELRNLIYQLISEYQVLLPAFKINSKGLHYIKKEKNPICCIVDFLK